MVEKCKLERKGCVCVGCEEGDPCYCWDCDGEIVDFCTKRKPSLEQESCAGRQAEANDGSVSPKEIVETTAAKGVAHAENYSKKNSVPSRLARPRAPERNYPRVLTLGDLERGFVDFKSEKIFWRMPISFFDLFAACREWTEGVCHRLKNGHKLCSLCVGRLR